MPKRETAPKISMRAPGDLIPYERNARTHSEQQVAMIAASIGEFGFRNPVLVDGGNGIIAGHARVRAAVDLGLAKIPTIDCSDMNDTQRRAYILADNRLALNAGWDQDLLALELQDLTGLDVDLESLGFSEDELAKLFGIEGKDRYTQKIESPIYEPTGERPAVRELFDDIRTDELQAEIDAANLPEEVADFLSHTAARHTVFDFSKIAEFYAHADEDTQALMERSALVIIDFDKAIDQGFIKLTNAAEDEYEFISS